MVLGAADGTTGIITRWGREGDDMKLKRGDIFCSRNPMALGRAINFIQKIHAKDNQSEYSHAGIIVVGGELRECGTFEALWTNKQQNFLKAYRGKKVLIGRHKGMTLPLFSKGWNGIKKHEGKWYAGHRLFFFFIPFVAKYISLGLGVCSELVGKFISKSGVNATSSELVAKFRETGESFYWRGLNPDDIADMIHKWKDYDVIFEGVLE